MDTVIRPVQGGLMHKDIHDLAAVWMFLIFLEYEPPPHCMTFVPGHLAAQQVVYLSDALLICTILLLNGPATYFMSFILRYPAPQQGL